MKLMAVVLLSSLLAACSTTTTSSTTWTAQPPPTWARPGHVESIREIVQRTQGNPAGGAVAGALIGGLLFGGHHHHPSLFGAAIGAATGAAVSQGTTESRTYEVLVRFDDGGHGIFVYANQSPFAPGQPVVLTPQGLGPR
ncbi:MAG TPA: hypothetical protein VGF45_15585 [Polyangia bacterium]